MFESCSPHFNLSPQRNPRKVRWTKAFRKVHGKEMTVDTTFEMEKRRNRPIKYDRDLVGTTLRAMQRASEVQEKRAALYYKNRMAKHKVAQTERARVEIKDEAVDLSQPMEQERDTFITLENKESQRTPVKA